IVAIGKDILVAPCRSPRKAACGAEPDPGPARIPAGGFRRIQGEPVGLGHSVAADRLAAWSCASSPPNGCTALTVGRALHVRTLFDRADRAQLTPAAMAPATTSRTCGR